MVKTVNVNYLFDSLLSILICYYYNIGTGMPSGFGTYILTGSHGAGSASETEVPLVVWGAGVAQPRPSTGPTAPPHWQLSHLLRLDVAQADVCPLMAALIGIPIPVHSVV